jgi:hypothetical protein
MWLDVEGKFVGRFFLKKGGNFIIPEGSLISFKNVSAEFSSKLFYGSVVLLALMITVMLYVTVNISTNEKRRRYVK